MSPQDEDAWFAPKRFGFGAGRPIRREGWVALVGYLALVGLASLLIPYSRLAFGIIFAAATVAFTLISASKTEGGWRWRWGERK